MHSDNYKPLKKKQGSKPDENGINGIKSQCSFSTLVYIFLKSRLDLPTALFSAALKQSMSRATLPNKRITGRRVQQNRFNPGREPNRSYPLEKEAEQG